MKLFVYIIFNVICQLVACWLLVMLNAYYNELFVPETLIGSSRLPLIKALIALAEGMFLVLMIYVNNRLVLTDAPDKKQRANTTFTVQIIFTVCFIVVITLC